MIQYRLVYAYYVGDEFTIIHKVHLLLLQMYINIFDNVDFILLINDNTNVEETKNLILSYLNRDDINFVIRNNDSFYREGIIYKEFIVDKLNDYKENELVFFGHTKGVTNGLNKKYLDNTIVWISLMYWCNLNKPYLIDYELIEKDNICFGAIYNYDSSNITKYHWQYAGSFQWINPKRLYELTKDNNKEFRDFNIKVIAEQFLGNNVSPEYAAFTNHTVFNKYHSLLLYDSHDYIYSNVWYAAYCMMAIDDTYEFINFLETTNILRFCENETSNDI